MFRKALISFFILGPVFICSAQQSGVDTPGLKDVYRNYFTIGVAVSPRALKTDEAGLILRQFGSLTAENAMKMGPVHPGEQEYNWAGADSIASFARQHGLKLRGHTLCWHNQTPEWFFKDGAGLTVSKELLLSRLKEHITTVVGRYKGMIYAWDVVNEAISDKADEVYRNSLFYQICGEEYIERAFEYAHAADPEALLFYNDYNETNPVKRRKIIDMIRKLKAKGVPVHGVGLQGHWSIYEPTPPQLDETLRDFVSLGINIQITELDISVYHKDEVASPYTEDMEARQTAQYKNCFEAFRKYGKEISAVTFWNISDRSSWLDNFPVRGRKNYPLLFDKDLKPKKAFYAVTSF